MASFILSSQLLEDTGPSSTVWLSWSRWASQTQVMESQKKEDCFVTTKKQIKLEYLEQFFFFILW